MSLDNLNKIQRDALGNNVPVDIATLIGNILPYIFGAAGIALLIYLVLGGFQMMTSRGDPKAMQSAQGKITNAIISHCLFVLMVFPHFPLDEDSS